MVPSNVPSGLTTAYGVKLPVKKRRSAASSPGGSEAASAHTDCHSAFDLSAKQLRTNAAKPSARLSSLKAVTSLHCARRRLFCIESGAGPGGGGTGGFASVTGGGGAGQLTCG